MSDPVRKGRPEAAAVIWDPDGGRGEASSAGAMRLAASGRAAIAGLASVTLLYFDHLAFGLVALVIGTLTLVLGLASPLGAYAALDRAVVALGRLVGGLLTWLLLAPFFFLVIAPFGLLTKRGKRDPLKRALDANATSHWQDRDAPRALDKPY